MRTHCGLILGIWVTGILFALDAAPLHPPVNLPDQLDKAIAGLSQVTSELAEAVKRFQTDLDREIAAHDRGFRTDSGRSIPGADADLGNGPSDEAETSRRKLFAARMIAARRPGYEPAPLVDSDHIQALILEARSRIATANNVMHQFLIVPAKELSSLSVAGLKAKRQELVKGRNAASEAAKKAFVALPVALSEADSAAQQRENAWDLMVAAMPGQPKTGPSPEPPPLLPVRFEKGKRITLIAEHCCRVTLTDSGMEDAQGRHLFYQEEWVRRPGNQARGALSGAVGITMLMRWAVAVNTSTGQHTLLRRYPLRELRGDFDDLYQLEDTDYVPAAPPPERSAPVSLPDLTSALNSVERSREDLRAALLGFRTQQRDALMRNDSLLAAQGQLPLDDELPNELRARLFAIRSRLAGDPVMLDAESRIRHAAEQAAGSVRLLEALVAWVNGNALERDAPVRDSRALPDSRVLLEALNRSDDAIHQIRTLEKEALAALPPDVPASGEAQFPALQRDLIVRIRQMRSPADATGTLRCREEVWRFAASVRGAREVNRTIVSIDLEPKSGRQTPAAREVKHYRIEPGETLEEIYDQNAAQ
jgi:hypothetical protein